MINEKQLCEFLVEAKKATYAAGDRAKSIKEKDKSTTLIYENGDWKYCDNYFGGEPYGGREVVFYENKPVYIMVYYGFVDKSISDAGSVYKVLQGALSQIPEDKPFRGPDKFEGNGLTYKNTHTGEVDNFSGEETIAIKDGKIIYKANYLGGFVDNR